MLPSQRRLLKARRSEVSGVTIAAKPKIVFDNQDLSAPYTQYTFKLHSAVSSSTSDAWKLRKRYSQCHAFHRQLRRTRDDWATCCASRGPEFEPVGGMLRQAAGSDFPRKHVRYDTEAIIQERRRGLAVFVQTLLAAYTDLEVLLNNVGNGGEGKKDCLKRISVELERFLQVPPKRKQVEARLTKVVLALQDVETPEEGVCGVCLGESEIGSGDKLLVRLPCEHEFHEDCIIRWLQCSSTCPICRRDVMGQR